MNQFTIKRSIRRSVWQAKAVNHDILHLGHLETVLKPCLRSLGFDPEDRQVLVLATFDDAPFDGHQFELRAAEPPAGAAISHPWGAYYELAGELAPGTGGYVPPFVYGNASAAPNRLYFRLERATRPVMVNTAKR